MGVTEGAWVGWRQVFTDNLNPPLDGVIQVWIDKATLTPVVEAGYDALLSAGWYLDRQLPVGDSSTHYSMLRVRVRMRTGYTH
jgi:hypothetical protein